MKSHGAKKNGTSTPEYNAWQNIKARCHCVSNKDYMRYYGSRGIKVCERWRESFEVFFADMGPRPSSEHSIDRIDNDGDYEPGNCQWATRKEQNRNSRHNRLVAVGSETIPLSVACELAGMEYHKVKKRLRRGWSIERALEIHDGPHAVGRVA